MQTEKINVQKIKYALQILSLFLFVFLIVPSSVQAQNDKTENVEVKMKDGTTIIAELIRETDDKLFVKNAGLGEITILKSNIIEFKKLRSSSFVNGVYWRENPNPTRNVYGPTGYGLRKGEGYYQNFLLFLNQVSYGFTDNFTIGVGMEIVSILGGLNSFGDGPNIPGFTITPKFSIPIQENKWNVGVGVLAAHFPGQDELFSAGIIYGVSTWGSRENNFTLGLGFGVAGGELTARPTITLSGNKRVGKRLGLVTENWFFPLFDDNYGSLLSFGGRYIGERLSWDFALLGIGGDGEFLISPIPLIGITIPFGTGWKG